MNLRSTSTLRVLVVTSNRELESRVTSILAPMNCSVQTIQEIFAAIKVLLDNDPPEIVLLGPALGKNALGLATRLSHSSNRKRTWILLLTHVMDSATVAAAVEAGIDDLLLCPSSCSCASPFRRRG